MGVGMRLWRNNADGPLKGGRVWADSGDGLLIIAEFCCVSVGTVTNTDPSGKKGV